MKTILIIGGSKGIGKAIIDLLKDDHQIIAISRTETESHPNITHYSLDILNDELPTIDQEINGLVYCPGSINLKPFTGLSIEDFKSDFEINVIGAVKTVQKYINNLKKGNGSVILFSTVATHLGMPYHASVAASKSAVEGLMKSLAGEYATKVRFNCIAPTVTETTLAEKLLRNDKQKENIQMRHPLQRYLKAEEVANLAEYLLSNKAEAISGQVFPIDAGIVSLKL
ncbi:SDR family NAD(P)-dependent oxidoreductase [Aureibacter tunicatorum]|uniref:NAD(P)-dependent dehydrogenase (Short-subunit alcohol dehydrogenase family) n=1 Tax=Aureibacter tunicatorum TaxID=866807 RepID=A0AAE4BS08_9BACT|nr:SDR family oxidoreductase [Aureibacter tunicatorum]MDR6237837.1 NAD(P)-dependent dehydrogenase (short-subunit alcohol dehydrogenase family) [Aureibacter tunicatorum]BDD02872.1 oxidoreductase [Aureibacter tunicatorum]